MDRQGAKATDRNSEPQQRTATDAKVAEALPGRAARGVATQSPMSDQPMQVHCVLRGLIAVPSVSRASSESSRSDRRAPFALDPTFAVAVPVTYIAAMRSLARRLFGAPETG